MKNQEKEIWKDIPNYEGYYQVSNLGNVRSIDRIVNGRGIAKIKLKGKIKKYIIDNVGYNTVGLSKKSKVNNYRIHVLVAIAFLNHKPNGHKTVVDHIDGNKQNNKLSNLQLISHRHNVIKGGVSTKKHFNIIKHVNSYAVRYNSNGESYYKGGFITLKEAIEYRNKWN